MAIHVLEYLESSCGKYPEKTVLIDQEHTLSYKEALKAAKTIGTEIAERSGEMKRPVMVLSDRNIESVISFLGTAYSGNFYVPVSVNLPENRISLYVETIDPIFILCRKQDEELAELIRGDRPVLIYEDLMEGEIREELLGERRQKIIDTDPLYLIFTSGSTGTPKGVIKSQRSILAFVEQFLKISGITEEDVLGGQAPFDFDVSAKDIYSTLAAGATLVILPKAYFSFPKKLMDCLSDHKVTTLIWAVSAVSIVASHRAFDYKVPDTIRRVLFSGEVMPVAHLNYWREFLPDAMFVNLYAPTEVTGNCTYYVVDREFKEDETLPLGTNFPNIDVMVLDQEGKRVEKGQTGEIYVRGAFLSMGYYGNEERTKGVFVQNPLQKYYRDIVYKTGDLALRDENGEYRFLTREDFQIKHNGHRIELGEIETAAYGIPGIRHCACVYLKEKKKIYMFAEGEDQDQKTVFMGLKKRIPKYMFPNKIVLLEDMPMNKNLKIDRQKLLKTAEELDNTKRRRVKEKRADEEE